MTITDNTQTKTDAQIAVNTLMRASDLLFDARQSLIAAYDVLGRITSNPLLLQRLPHPHRRHVESSRLAHIATRITLQQITEILVLAADAVEHES